MTNIAVLVSGSGTNLQSIIDSCSSGFIPGKIKLVISSKKKAYALKRARKAGIETSVIEPGNYAATEEYSKAILNEIKKRKIDLICLAGFMHKVGENIINEYKGRILNIHPALLPGFGGKGMYGLNVHRAVIEAGEKVSGCTVHYVDELYDHGPVIMQREVPVKESDTPRQLAERVLKEEHKLYPAAIKKVIEEIKKGDCGND